MPSRTSPVPQLTSVDKLRSIAMSKRSSEPEAEVGRMRTQNLILKSENRSPMSEGASASPMKNDTRNRTISLRKKTRRSRRRPEFENKSPEKRLRTIIRVWRTEQVRHLEQKSTLCPLYGNCDSSCRSVIRSATTIGKNTISLRLYKLSAKQCDVIAAPASREVDASNCSRPEDPPRVPSNGSALSIHMPTPCPREVQSKTLAGATNSTIR
ncbi:hypothetical protein DPSP01_004409 [Paraphaeosphaeria sporulosa]|uniref:Uncharacterized protein n=1 Tax=Paraphaeosphaeria sporulosa TaxID=1460663 RepID=A0A177CJT7_9PLEO|nr:uncharacterized protein CC84DRAFT_1174959 [Paraphaeosphaeria sporulosa]OAG07090.1 hypothetical protein CC84DRAFT_1174959 [Paraphaeosphaeria sporulosa]